MLGGKCLYELDHLTNPASPFICLLLHSFYSFINFMHLVHPPGFTSRPMQSLVTVEQGRGSLWKEMERKHRMRQWWAVVSRCSPSLILHGHPHPF